MKQSISILALIAGTVCVTLLRNRYPEADKALLSFIDRNMILIAAALVAFFVYSGWLLLRHWKSSSNKS